MLVYSPFMLTAAMLSGVCKEASEGKRLTADAPFFSPDSASHSWSVYTHFLMFSIDNHIKRKRKGYIQMCVYSNTSRTFTVCFKLAQKTVIQKKNSFRWFSNVTSVLFGTID